MPLYDIIDKGNGEGKVKLNFHGGQRRVYASGARFIFMLAGTQVGKTEMGPWWMRREIDRCGSGEYLVVSPTYPLQNLKVVPAYEEVFDHVLNIGKYR